VRRERLAARHRRYGRTEAQARERTLGSDEDNARTVLATRHRADLLVADLLVADLLVTDTCRRTHPDP
jgi:pantothenate kinase